MTIQTLNPTNCAVCLQFFLRVYAEWNMGMCLPCNKEPCIAYLARCRQFHMSIEQRHYLFRNSDIEPCIKKKKKKKKVESYSNL